MKIAHINYFANTVPAGVAKKIQQQAKAAKKLAIDMDFLIVNPSIEADEDNLKFIKFQTISKSRVFSGIERYFFQFYLLEKNIDFDQYDYIILRYPGVGLAGMHFVKKFGYKMITEHHSNKVAELKIQKKNLSMMLTIFLENTYAPKFLSKIKGLIGVTNEIREIELNKCKCNVNTCTVSNGIDVTGTLFTGFKKFNGQELHIIFVASKFDPWQGLDNLLNGLKKYKGNVFIHLNLIGDVSAKDIRTIDEINNDIVNINLLGKKYGVELDKEFKDSNIAISSLALYRKNMEEACSLKTREYIARGIPFVYSYNDSDLAGDEVFALKLPVNDTFIDIDEIIKFAIKVSEELHADTKMRDFAKQKLDWTIKVAQMETFVKSISSKIKEGH